VWNPEFAPKINLLNPRLTGQDILVNSRGVEDGQRRLESRRGEAEVKDTGRVGRSNGGQGSCRGGRSQNLGQEKSATFIMLGLVSLESDLFAKIRGLPSTGDGVPILSSLKHCFKALTFETGGNWRCLIARTKGR